MKAAEALKDERFRKGLDIQIKKFIDGAMQNAGKDIPKPLTDFPLSYQDKSLNSAVKRMRLGGEIALNLLDVYVEKTNAK